MSDLFNIGDKVKCINKDRFGESPIMKDRKAYIYDKSGEITHIGGNLIIVKFDEVIELIPSDEDGRKYFIDNTSVWLNKNARSGWKPSPVIFLSSTPFPVN